MNTRDGLWLPVAKIVW